MTARWPGGFAQYKDEFDPGSVRDAGAAPDESRFDLHGFATLLAGLPAPVHVPSFGATRETQAWLDHAREFDALFHSFDLRFARPFSQWAGVALEDARAAETVVYPMSGPDITFPSLLYPQAENYILCGLEPCEPLPDLALIDESRLQSVLPRLKTTMGHFLDHSYFVTADMRGALDDVFLPGVLPILLILLARMDCVIKSVNTFRLEPEPVTPGAALDGAASGVCIEFERQGPRRLFYIQQDLRDSFFSKHCFLYRLIAGLERPAALMKSASYLLHEPNFSTIRRLIMEKCATIVQDPSSLPYQFLLQHGCDVELHGNYAGTLPVFGKYEQRDLIDAYRRRPRKLLNFGFSYLKTPEVASLMVALCNTGRGRMSGRSPI